MEDIELFNFIFANNGFGHLYELLSFAELVLILCSGSLFDEMQEGLISL